LYNSLAVFNFNLPFFASERLNTASFIFLFNCVFLLEIGFAFKLYYFNVFYFFTLLGNPFGVCARGFFNNHGFHPWLLKENHFVVNIHNPSTPSFVSCQGSWLTNLAFQSIFQSTSQSTMVYNAQQWYDFEVSDTTMMTIAVF
jgi:hypothetical protein